jgi:hypothetical protein
MTWLGSLRSYQADCHGDSVITSYGRVSVTVCDWARGGLVTGIAAETQLAKTRFPSCSSDRTLPLLRRIGSEQAQRATGDEVAL